MADGRARIRSIKPDMPADEDLGRCCRDARLLFVLLLTRADDEGRFRAHPALLRGEIFPYDVDITTEDMQRWLGELAKWRLLTLYAVQGQSYGCFKQGKWKQHQKIDRPSSSTLPPPPKTGRKLDEDSSKPRRKIVERSMTDGMGGDGMGGDGSCAERGSPPDPANCFTTADGESYEAPPALLAAFCRAYPAVNLETEFEKIRAWLLTHPKNRKTPTGMPKFLNAWLGKAQDSARPIQGSPAPPSKSNGNGSDPAASEQMMRAATGEVKDHGIWREPAEGDVDRSGCRFEGGRWLTPDGQPEIAR